MDCPKAEASRLGVGKLPGNEANPFFASQRLECSPESRGRPVGSHGGCESECLYENGFRKEEESSQFTGICAGKSLIGAFWSTAFLEFLLSY